MPVGTWLNHVAIMAALVGCQYPAANPGEPEGAQSSTPKGAVVSGDLQVPRSSKLLKCLCADITTPSARQDYPVIANETTQRQERCSYLANEEATSTQKRPYLEVKVSRVLTQNSYTIAIDRWRNRLILNPKETTSMINANDEQTVVEGEDGDYKVLAIALYKSQSGILITTEENAPKDHSFAGTIPPDYFSNVKAAFPSVCE